MKSLFFSLFILFSSFINSQVVSSGSFIKFKIKNAGLTVDGTFDKVSATITYSPQKVFSSQFYGEINVASISTGINLRDNHLKKEDYFDVQRFPLIKFKSTVVSKNEKGRLNVIGDLTIKGITKKVMLDVSVAENGNQFVFNTSIKLNRRDFEVGGSSWTLSDELVANIQISYLSNVP